MTHPKSKTQNPKFSFPRYPHYKDSGVEWFLFYRNAVLSHSPGLAHRAYPGITRPAIINPNGVVSSSGITAPRRTQPRWGKSIFYRNAVPSQSPGLAYFAYPGITRPAIIKPNGVATSAGIAVPRRTQPRWGIIYPSTYSQGSRCPATLRFGMESRWDKSISYRNAVPSHSPGLAHRAYPGITCHATINPNGVVSSSGISAPRRTQPRWGIMSHHTPTQGSRCAATLRSVTESRWDKYTYRNAVSSHSPGLRIALPWEYVPTIHQPRRGCVLFRVHRPTPDTTPLGYNVPPHAHTQGSRCAATLGFVTISRWDMENGGIS